MLQLQHFLSIKTRKIFDSNLFERKDKLRLPQRKAPKLVPKDVLLSFFCFEKSKISLTVGLFFLITRADFLLKKCTTYKVAHSLTSICLENFFLHPRKNIRIFS